MLAFFLDLLMVGTTVVRALRSDPEFRAIASLLVFLLAAGTVFYWQTQNWSLVDSFYFCVMTIATVGYGDLTPDKDVTKIFTIAFTVLGIGLFASFVGKLVALRVASHLQASQKRHRDKAN